VNVPPVILPCAEIHVWPGFLDWSADISYLTVLRDDETGLTVLRNGTTDLDSETVQVRKTYVIVLWFNFCINKTLKGLWKWSSLFIRSFFDITVFRIYISVSCDGHNRQDMNVSMFQPSCSVTVAFMQRLV
jgi:hypothetical protein